MRDLVTKYLRAVFPPGSKGYFAVCSSEPGRKSGGMISRHFIAADLEGAASHILSEDAAGRNTYVTLCAHDTDPGPYKRGTRAEKVSAAVLWVDIDVKGHGHVANDLPETTEDLVYLLKAVDFEPSFIVATGGGYHAYWKLAAPLALDADGGRVRSEFQELARSLQRRIGEAAAARGWHLDTTSDLARVLRPTGTHNHKPGRMGADGQPVGSPLVTFLIGPDEGTTYDYRMLRNAIEVKEDKISKLFGSAPTLAPGVGADGSETDGSPDADAPADAPVATRAATGTAWDAETTTTTIRDKIKRNKHPERTEALNAFAAGLAWARRGERDAMAQRLASWLAFFTGGEGDLDAILEMAAPSLAVMDAEHPPVTEEWFAEKLTRALGDARRQAARVRAADKRMEERMFASARGKHQERPRTALAVSLPLGAPATAAPATAAPSPSIPLGAPAPAPAVSVGETEPGAAKEAVNPEVVAGGAVAGPIERLFGAAALALAPAAEPGDEEATTYYTRAELEAAAKDQGDLSGVDCTLDDLKHRLIIQKGETFFHLKRCADGFWRYGEPLQRGELDVAIPDDFLLLPEQIEAGAGGGGGDDVPRTGQGETFFAWHVPKPDGTVRRKSVKEVLAELCTVARGEVVYDLRIPRSYFDPRSGTFYVAACPVKPHIDPEFDDTIDQWLRTFGENEADREKWLDFCATITDLRYPTCGVFLSGPPDTGKTMFATGAARLWADDFTNMDDVFSSAGFNSGLASCPLIVADEALPTDNSGRTVSTKLLRRLIGSDRRALRRKYMSNATIVGAVRCLFLANNEDMIGQGDESLGADALEAVAGRFLHIKVTRAAHDFLFSIGGRGGVSEETARANAAAGLGGAATRPGAGTRGWVDEDKIAKHLLWLRDNRRVKYGHRFIVDGHESKVSQLLATNGVIPGLVCEWLARFLNKPSESILRARTVVLGGKKLWVNGQALLDAWQDLIKSDRSAPTLTKVNKALGGISFPREDAAGHGIGADREYVKTLDAGGREVMKRIRYWHVRPEVILDYADQNQIGDPDAMRARIEGPEIEFKGSLVGKAFGN